MTSKLEPRGDQPPAAKNETSTEQPDYAKVLKDYFESFSDAVSEFKGKVTAQLQDFVVDGLEGAEGQQVDAAGAPRGTLSWQISSSEMAAGTVENGEIKDKDGKVIGKMRDDGQVTLNGRKFSIKESEGVAFHGTGSDGNALDMVSASQQGALTGVFTSPDGKQHYDVVNGNIYNEQGGFEGNIDGDGVLTSIALDGRTAFGDLNSRFADWNFRGTENGQPRAFQASSDLVNGTVSLPGENGEFIKFDVKLGMLIDQQTGEQKGWLTAPTEAEDGTLVGGFIYRIGADGKVQSESLASFRYASFDLEHLGTTGVEARNIIGVSLGMENQPGQANGYLNIQKASDLEGKVIDRARDEIEEINGRDKFYRPGYLFGWNEDATNAANDRIAHAQLRSREYRDLIAEGEVDATDVESIRRRMNANTRELGSGAQSVDQPPDQNSEPIEIPQLDDESVDTVNGKLRIGEEIYDIRGGELFRVRQSQVGGETVSVTDEQASGRLNADYTAEFEGRGRISLADQNRVLMEFTIGADDYKNQVIGLGASKWTDTYGYTGGGLVNVRQLNTRMHDMMFDASQGVTGYYDQRPDSTGILGNFANGGTEEMLQQFSDIMSKDKKNLDAVLADTFANGFDLAALDTSAFNTRIGFTQTIVEGLGLSATDSVRIAQEGTHMQKMINNGVVAGVTGVLTAGLGSALAAANTAKVIQLSRLGMMAAEIGGGAVIGAGVSVAGRTSETSDWRTNAASGGLEGALMGLGGAGGRALQGFRQTEAAVVAALTTGGKLTASQAASMSARLLASLGPRHTANLSRTVRSLYYGAEALTQSTGFDIANMMREGGNLSDAFGAERMAIGSMAMLVGRAAGNANIPGVRDRSMTQGMVQNVTNSYATGFVQGVDQALHEQDVETARRLGMKLEDISSDVLEQYRDYAAVLDTAVETAAVSAATSVASAPFAHAAEHGFIPRKKGATTGRATLEINENGGSSSGDSEGSSPPSISDPEPFAMSFDPDGTPVAGRDPFAFSFVGGEGKPRLAPSSDSAEPRLPSISDPEPFAFSFDPDGAPLGGPEAFAFSFAPDGAPVTDPRSTAAGPKAPSIPDPEPFAFLFDPDGTPVAGRDPFAFSFVGGEGAPKKPTGTDASPTFHWDDGANSSGSGGDDLHRQASGADSDSALPAPTYADIPVRIKPFAGANIDYAPTEKAIAATKWLTGFVDRYMQGDSRGAYNYLSDPANRPGRTKWDTRNVVVSASSLDPAIAGSASAERILSDHLIKMGESAGAGEAYHRIGEKIEATDPLYEIREPHTVLELASGTTIDIIDPTNPLHGGELTAADRAEIDGFMASEAGRRIMDRHAMILAEEFAHVRQMDNNYLVISESFARFIEYGQEIENGNRVRKSTDELWITANLSPDGNNRALRSMDSVELEIPGMFYDAGLPADVIRETLGHKELRKPFFNMLASQQPIGPAAAQPLTADTTVVPTDVPPVTADVPPVTADVPPATADASPAPADITKMSRFEKLRRYKELDRLRSQLQRDEQDLPEFQYEERRLLRAELLGDRGDGGTLGETMKKIRSMQPELDAHGKMTVRNEAAGARMEATAWNTMVDLMNGPIIDGKTPAQLGLELVKVTPGSAADGIGWDMLLVNKKNGEFIHIDIKDKKSLAGYPQFHQSNAIQILSFEPLAQRREVREQFEKIVRRLSTDGSPLNILDFDMPIETYALADIVNDVRSYNDDNAWRDLNMALGEREQKLDVMTRQLDELYRNYNAAGDKASAKVVADLLDHIDLRQMGWLRRVQDAARARNLAELNRHFR